MNYRCELWISESTVPTNQINHFIKTARSLVFQVQTQTSKAILRWWDARIEWVTTWNSCFTSQRQFEPFPKNVLCPIPNLIPKSWRLKVHFSMSGAGLDWSKAHFWGGLCERWRKTYFSFIDSAWFSLAASLLAQKWTTFLKGPH